MMLQNNNDKMFSLFCDQSGQVTQVLQDKDHLLPSSLIGNMFFSIVAPGDLDKILNFFLELKDKGSAIGWEININILKGTETFSFFGGIFNEQIGIAAATSKNEAQVLFSDFTRINNEQVNLIRAMTKENKELQTQFVEAPVNYYEELSRLNNELVNMQRELSKKNRELDELNKLKNEFLGIAAHDLRSPLSVIMGYSNFVLEETQGTLSQDHVTMLKSILTSSKFMLNLLNDLLDVAAIESGKLNLNLMKTDITKLIQKNVELNNVIAQKKNINILFNQPVPIPEFTFDEGKIEQVLNNLVSNAVKFSQAGTIVEVSINLHGSEAIVSVKDHGQGIPENEIGKLFEPFEKTSVRSTAGEKSTGLGLSIVRKLIIGHKGKIWVESKVGVGSTFFFSLPL